MKRLIITLIYLILTISVPSVYANTIHDNANGGNGQKGGSRDGTAGLPGCDGGTNPSEDGKFYLPGTHQECNPSDEDAKKVKKPAKA
ncbi:hypothetical protein ACP179_03655 [Xenorhabdus stockiae]|uniref:hypothetical protein n=1 Tax=Xenorhabdus stockiae TaxID=351614 RepID=UPI003CEAED43